MAKSRRSAKVDPKTLESGLVRGLYFAGEVLDLDGLIGGYNFQAAWSTEPAGRGNGGDAWMISAADKRHVSSPAREKPDRKNREGFFRVHEASRRSRMIVESDSSANSEFRRPIPWPDPAHMPRSRSRARPPATERSRRAEGR